jgi:hypothetical protein
VFEIVRRTSSRSSSRNLTSRFGEPIRFQNDESRAGKPIRFQNDESRAGNPISTRTGRSIHSGDSPVPKPHYA